MGTRITKEISDETRKGLLECFSYKDIDEAFIQDIIADDEIEMIQISKELPYEAYIAIDSVLARKPELIFRIYGFYSLKRYDISFLKKMPHLRNLRIELHLSDWDEVPDFNILTGLNLRSLHIDSFDLKDYTFVKNLSENLEELIIFADTMSGSIQFDCRWLLRYKKLHTLWLGKKAKKNIECLSEIKSIKSLSLRGIKLTSFDFLKEMKLEKFELLWNSNNDLRELKELKSLKQISLWRINKLNNIDFISELENLEIIKLQDLKHITRLPDLSGLSKLRTIVLDNTGVSKENIEEPYKSMVRGYWR